MPREPVAIIAISDDATDEDLREMARVIVESLAALPKETVKD